MRAELVPTLRAELAALVPKLTVTNSKNNVSANAGGGSQNIRASRNTPEIINKHCDEKCLKVFIQYWVVRWSWRPCRQVAGKVTI